MKIGDRFFLDGKPAVEVEVSEMHPTDHHRPTKLKAVIPDPRLAKLGFLQEGDDYVAVEWTICKN